MVVVAAGFLLRSVLFWLGILVLGAVVGAGHSVISKKSARRASLSIRHRIAYFAVPAALLSAALAGRHRGVGIGCEIYYDFSYSRLFPDTVIPLDECGSDQGLLAALYLLSQPAWLSGLLLRFACRSSSAWRRIVISHSVVVGLAVAVGASVASWSTW